MTRVLLIHAGPTPWDEENRLVGSYNMPLTADALVAATSLVANLTEPFAAICLDRQNEACEQIAQLIHQKFDAKLKDYPDLIEWHLGLWEGLTREEVRRRFPSVIAEWMGHPQQIEPPEGESLVVVFERIAPAVQKILKKYRGRTIAIVVRPYVMQVVRGLLIDEDLTKIASHLQNVDVMETIELADTDLDALLEK